MTEVTSAEDILAMIESAKGVKNVECVTDRHGFWRTIRFNCLGVGCSVTWYKNECTFENSSVQVNFHKFKIAGTWPNKYKNNFHLIYNDDVIAVVPCEKYEDDTY